MVNKALIRKAQKLNESIVLASLCGNRAARIKLTNQRCFVLASMDAETKAAQLSVDVVRSRNEILSGKKFAK